MEAGGPVRPEDVDGVFLYDAYPVMALIQAADLGLVPAGDRRQARWTRAHKKSAYQRGDVCTIAADAAAPNPSITEEHPPT